MIQFIHLSDFHLNTKNLNDWKSYVRGAFVKIINECHLDMSNTIFICSGDLIDKGGFESSAIQAFTMFKLEVIDYICTEFQISIERFLIVPGNHDIVRSNDSERSELGSREYYKNYDKILSSVVDMLDKKEREGVKRMIPYFEFEADCYNKVQRYTSFLGNAIKYTIDGFSVGISCLNSAWRAYDNEDKKFIILGEEQLARCSSFIETCDVKIAIMHHPLDWFNMEKNIISNHINKDYDLLFVGHVHESSTMTQTGFTGTLFTNIAPSCTSDIREDSRAFSNGFTLIKYDKQNKEIDCNYYKYNHERTEFILNVDLGEDGRFFHKIPDPNSTTTQNLIERCLANIKENFYLKIDEHIIAQKAHVIPSIKEAFVMPPLTEQITKDNDEILYISLDELCKSKQNQCIFGAQEIGKTTLLYRIIREYVDEYSHLRKIPVYIDMKEMGNQEITTLIKDFLRCSSENANKIIKDNLIILIIDNFDYTTFNENRINRINAFYKENESIQIMSTTINDIMDVPSEGYLRMSKIPFRNLFLRPLKSAHIRGLMKKWIPEDEETKRDAKLEKMVNHFCSYSLPCTAMSVSLFLWSTENSEKKPINQAVLLDIYIEIILEKLSKENIYRDTFDYKNKSMLLAKIAQEMLESNLSNYAITYSEYIGIITQYIKDVGFDYDVARIGEYFIERKVFAKVNVNQIKFSHSCFFNFFIAKRMEFDISFREKVLSKEKYHMFPRELDYYTGLTRNDKKTLELIYERFQEAFSGIKEIVSVVDDIDKYFTYIIKNQATHSSASKSIDITQIKENRPADKNILEFYDNKLSTIPNDEIRKKIDDFNLEKLIIIMCTVLRNSEGVEAYELKKEIYNSIIENAVLWTILYKDCLVDYVKKNNSLPPFIPQKSNFLRFLQFLPMNIQGGINSYLGTYKLTPIILEKIKQDNKNKTSDVESYFSTALYWDNVGSDFPKIMKKFIRRLSNNIVRDYCLLKLLDYYYRKTKTNTNEEEMCLGLLTELKIRNEKLPRRVADKVKQTLQEGKLKFLKKNNLVL